MKILDFACTQPVFAFWNHSPDYQQDVAIIRTCDFALLRVQRHIPVVNELDISISYNHTVFRPRLFASDAPTARDPVVVELDSSMSHSHTVFRPHLIASDISTASIPVVIELYLSVSSMSRSHTVFRPPLIASDIPTALSMIPKIQHIDLRFEGFLFLFAELPWQFPFHGNLWIAGAVDSTSNRYSIRI